MYNCTNCNESQNRILESMPYFFLSREEQVDFHFMMHMRNQLHTSDFLDTYEANLIERKFKSLRSAFEKLSEWDYRNSFLPMEEYSPEALDGEKFRAMIGDKYQPPFVVRGLISGTTAVENWSHEYFIDNCEDVELTAFDYSGEQSNTRFILDSAKLGLKDILRSQVDDKNKRNYYINNSAELFRLYPEMIDELGAKRIRELFKGHSLHTFCQLFIGNQKTWGTSWHAGNGTSSALMVNGSKRWVFMDPRLMYVLRPFFDGSNILAKTDVRHDIEFHRIHNPLYAFAPKLLVDLQPGDVLFFNRYWPHAVINQTPLHVMATMRWTIDPGLAPEEKARKYSTLLPAFDNILKSDPTFLKFQFEVFSSLSQDDRYIGDRVYFSQFNNQNQPIGEGR